jgi:hypothetical protein
MNVIKITSKSFIFLWLAFALSSCNDNPIDTELLRQAYYGSHLKPWDFSMDNLSEAQSENLSRASALVYNSLKVSLGEDHALIQEINKSTPERDVAMMRVAALQSVKARACLWAFEMHFVANGESQWRSTLSYEIILMNVKDLRVNVSNFGSILDMPYSESENEAFEREVGELLQEVELNYFQSMAQDYATYIRPNL